MIELKVIDQKIEVLRKDVVASGQIAFVDVSFDFNESWDGLHKVAQFEQEDEDTCSCTCQTSKRKTYNRVLGTDGLSCKLPPELEAGVVKISVFGYSPTNNSALRITTVPVCVRIYLSGLSADGEDEIPPTPDLYQQLLGKIDERASQIQDGADGDSAYQIAVNHGYVGTEEEWLVSLKGKDGTNGADGEQGPPGTPGTPGSPGLPGKDGRDGADGQPGRDGKDGADGLNGTNGDSAYQIAVNHGFVGTESEWLASLKGKDGVDGKQGLPGAPGEPGTPGTPGKDGRDGADGQPGRDGRDGTNGINGTDGTDGESAYQTWIKLGHTGSESDFINSLKGEKGDKGDPGSPQDVEDLKRRTTALEEAAHVHSNISSLNSISPADITNIQQTFPSEIYTLQETIAGLSLVGLATEGGGEIFNDYEGNTALSAYDHAEGYKATASGGASHAEGNGTEASGVNSHAEGAKGKATGQYSHVQNFNNTASGIASTAEGNGTEASGDSSHSEGASTKASGGGSHAEGSGTESGGIVSHAQGIGSKAVGNYSDACGEYTIAKGIAQTVIGKFNLVREETFEKYEEYAFIVGNGKSVNERSNAFELTWTGYGLFSAGAGTVSEWIPADDGDFVTKKYVDDILGDIESILAGIVEV